MAQNESTLEALYFERTQNPKEKSDYFDAVRHESSEGKALVENLRKLHQQVAKEVPLDEYVLAYPVEDIAGEIWTCVSACSAVRDQGPRPFVRMQTVAVRCSQLEAAGIDVVSLCYAAKWGWLHEQRPARFELEIAPQQLVAANYAFCKSLAGALSGEPPLAPESWPQGLGFKELMSGIKAALLQVPPERRARACFAVRVPARLKTSLKLSFVYLEPERPKDRSLVSQPRTAVEFIGRLHDLATAFYVDKNIVEPWRQRLWDQCQDVIEYMETATSPNCRDRKRATRNAEVAFTRLGLQATAAKAPPELLQRIRTYENQIEFYVQMSDANQVQSEQTYMGEHRWWNEKTLQYATYAALACIVLCFAVVILLPKLIPGFRPELPGISALLGGDHSNDHDSPTEGGRNTPSGSGSKHGLAPTKPKAGGPGAPAGNGVKAEKVPKLDIEPITKPITFKPTRIAKESEPKEVRIKNAGQAPATVWLTPSGDFWVDPDLLRDFKLKPREVKTVKVVFAPRIGGEQTGELQVESDDPKRRIARVQLRGTGVEE